MESARPVILDPFGKAARVLEMGGSFRRTRLTADTMTAAKAAGEEFWKPGHSYARCRAHSRGSRAWAGHDATVVDRTNCGGELCVKSDSSPIDICPVK